MKELFKALDESLENNDAKWYELYNENDLSSLEKFKLVSYIKAYFRTSGMPSDTIEQRIGVLTAGINFCKLGNGKNVVDDTRSIDFDNYRKEIISWQKDENSVYYKKYNNKEFSKEASISEILEQRLYEILDKSLENNDSEWYNSNYYKLLGLSNLGRQKLISYVAGYFKSSGMPTDTSEQRTAVVDKIVDFCTMGDERFIIGSFRAPTEEIMIEDCKEEVKAWQEDENSFYYKTYNNKEFGKDATAEDILEHKSMEEFVSNHIFLV